MCGSNSDDALMGKHEVEEDEEEPALNEVELALLEEMEDKRIKFQDLLKCIEKGLETKRQFLSIPKANVAKVEWHEVLEFSKELHEAALIWIELKLFEPRMFDNATNFFDLLSHLLKMANGTMVGAEKSLRKCIHTSVEAVVDEGFDLIAGASTPFERDEERRIRTIKLVARFLNSLDDLKRTPTNNIAAIEIQLLMVTGEMYDVLKLWKESKKGFFDAPSLAAHEEMKPDLFNDDASVTNQYSKPMKKALDHMNEHVNVVAKATGKIWVYLTQMLSIIDQFLTKKDEEGVVVGFEEILPLCKRATSRIKEALVHTQNGPVLEALFDDADKAMLDILLIQDGLDIEA